MADVTAKQLVLVNGVGRSGTSAFAGILRELGFHVPQPEVQADETNPRGFGEPRWVVDFHTRLQKRLFVTNTDSRPQAWDDTAALADDPVVLDELRSWLEVQLVGVDRVVIKDPRLPWFLPLWRRCTEQIDVECSYATMLRAPTEMLGSARHWYGTWQNDASRAAGWLNVMFRTEWQTRDTRRVFVRYDNLLADWHSEISRVGRRLALPELVDVDERRRAGVDAFIDPQLRRQTPGWGDLAVPASVRDLVDRTWEQLLLLADDESDETSVRTKLDELAADYTRLHAEAEAIVQSTIRAAKRKRRAAAQEPTRSKETTPAKATPAAKKPAAKPATKTPAAKLPAKKRSLPRRIAGRARRALRRTARRRG